MKRYTGKEADMVNLTPSKEINDIYNQTSDTNMGGTGIGNSAPQINLDKQNESTGLEGFGSIEHQIEQAKNDPFTPYNENTGLGGLQSLQDQIKQNQKELEELINKEPEKTQGQLEQELSDLIREQEQKENIYDKLNNMGTSSAKDKQYILNLLSQEELDMLGISINGFANKVGDITSITASTIKQEKINEALQYLTDKYQKELGNIKDSIYNIKNNSSYDNRTDSQIREDEKDSSAYQRTVEDMRKAGLNPAMIGGVGHAGGGGGSSKADEEEEKRKRKKREALERLRAEQQRKMQQQQQLLYMVSMLGGAGGMIGSGLIRNAGYTKFWEAQMAKNKAENGNFNEPSMKSKTTNTKQHTTRNEPEWLEKYLKEIDEMG